MKPLFTLLTNPGFALRQGAIALMLATPLTLALNLPAQAGFMETVRSIFTGDTREGAQGNARGASIRDRRCGADAAEISSSGMGAEDGESAIAATDAPDSASEPLILLVPNTGQTLTTTEAAPAVFVYIPPSPSSLEEPEHSSIPDTTAPKLNRTKLDIDDIDSVVDEEVQNQIEQSQQPELLLEFQFNGTTRYYALPDEALIAKIQPPENTPFEIGETSPLEVRFICRRVDLTSLSATAATESNDSTEAEVFVDVQRVAASDELTAAMATYTADELYQAYLDNGLWFEMVASLAANPDSQEWSALLEELEIPDVDPMPQTLTPLPQFQ